MASNSLAAGARFLMLPNWGSVREASRLTPPAAATARSSLLLRGRLIVWRLIGCRFHRLPIASAATDTSCLGFKVGSGVFLRFHPCLQCFGFQSVDAGREKALQDKEPSARRTAGTARTKRDIGSCLTCLFLSRTRHYPITSCRSTPNSNGGMSRLRGAGPRRILPEVS